MKAVVDARTRHRRLAPSLRFSLRMNRILIVGDDKFISAQARTYAEYRVFSALARHTRKFRRVRVVLRQRDDRGTCDTVACAVTVALEPSGSVRIRVTRATRLRSDQSRGGAPR